MSGVEDHEVQYQAKKKTDQSLQGIVINANCEEESVKVINDDNKGAIGEAGKERVLFIKETLGILRKMEH